MRFRRGWLLALFAVLAVAVPVLEVWLLIEVGHAIGAGWTLLVLLAEAVLGGWLVRREGRRAWSALTGAVGTGRLPTGELADAALVLVGGVLLFLPGFVTDVVGFVFLLPLTRPAARRLVAFLVARRVQRLRLPVPSGPAGDVVEGQTVEDGTVGEPTAPQRVRGEVTGR